MENGICQPVHTAILCEFAHSNDRSGRKPAGWVKGVLGLSCPWQSGQRRSVIERKAAPCVKEA